MTMRTIAEGGAKVVDILELIQKVSGIGGAPAAAVLAAIHQAATAAISGSDTDIAAAVAALRQHLTTDEAADDAAAQAAENARWPEGTPTNPANPAQSKK